MNEEGREGRAQRSPGLYLVAAIISAAISATGWILTANWEYIFPRDDPVIPKPDSTSVSARVDEDIMSPEDGVSVAPGLRAFGRWMRRQENRVYRAESDGFVAIFTGGDNPADGALIYVGQDDPPREVATRTGRYDGAVSPVSRGDYWRVVPDDNGTVVIQWLPISRSVFSVSSSRAFGQWTRRRENRVYRAESDGFVAVFTGGDNPANGALIHVGQDDPPREVVTRTGRYDGAVSPVSRGDYWRVVPDGDGTVVVQWLPVAERIVP